MAVKRRVTFSQPVLRGLQAMGFSLAAIRRAARISPQLLIDVLDGRRELTDTQIGRLETLSGRTGGDLAASVLEPDGGPLTELSKVWAGVHGALSSGRTPRRRRAASLAGLAR